MPRFTWASVAAQFRPAPSVEESMAAADSQHATEMNNVDVEIQKQTLTQRAIAEPGVARVEALQAVWGKKGKYFIIAG
jgi:hypothetical protein